MLRVPAILCSLILLVGCTTLDGNLKIDPNARVSGQLKYTIDKSLASLAGISSITDLKSRLNEPENGQTQSTFQNTCKQADISDSGSAYVILCTYQDSDFNSDEGFKVFRENGSNVFVFRQNLDSATNSNETIDLGTVQLDITFSHPVTKVQANKASLLTKLSPESYRIAGTASEPMDVRITADIPKGSSGSTNLSASPIPSNLIERAKQFKVAPKNFGGLVDEDMRFTRANSPYSISSTIQIPAGKTVYVEPGVVFDSILLRDKPESESSSFHIRGQLFLDGKIDSRIRLLGSPKTHFKTAFAARGSGIYANFIHVVGGNNIFWNDGRESKINFRIHNSRFVNIKNTWEIVYPYGINELVNNHFKESSQIRTVVHSNSGADSAELLIDGNKFEGLSRGYREKDKDCWIENTAYYGGKLRVSNNDFSLVKGYALCVLYADGVIDARSNYWGSTDPTRIGNLVLDAKDGLDYPSIIDVSFPLSKSPIGVAPLPASAAEADKLALSQAQRAKAEVEDVTVEAEEASRLAKIDASSSAGTVKANSTPKNGNTSADKGSQNISEKSITCIKGKSSLTVIGVKPKCPKGYKKR